MKDAEFVAIELDRIETKIQALIEMGVSRQDPDYLSHQVTAAAESMQHTEEAVNQLQHLTGLADQIEEPPPILEANIGGLVARDRYAVASSRAERRACDAELPGVVSGVGAVARRAVLLGHGVGVRAARQHVRPRSARRP